MAGGLPSVDALLDSLCSPNNDIRSAAERTYQEIPVQTRLTMLVQALSSPSIAVDKRSLCAVLIRRIFSTNYDEVWSDLAPELKTGIKQQLLVLAEKEQEPTMRNKICDAIAELLRNQSDDSGLCQWQEALTFMFDGAMSNNKTLKLASLHLLRCVPGVFGPHQDKYMDVLHQMLIQNMKSDDSTVRFDAVRATCAFLLENDKDTSVQQHFRDTLPYIIQAIAEGTKEGDDDALLLCLIELAENTPKFLRPQLENIIALCLKIISDETVDDSWRQLSTEVLVTLSETAPAMMRKHGKFMSHLVPQLLSMMVDLDDEENWEFQEASDEEDADSNAYAAESALDRLACGIGGKTMLPHITSNIPLMLQKDDWKYRHAALMAISACGEGCHKQMESMLGSIIDTVLPFMKDAHPRVQFAACNAIGQICTDFAPNVEKKFHQKICPQLLAMVGEYSYPRVQAHAAAALVNFSEDCPRKVLTLYLKSIIDCLEQVLTRKFNEMMEKGTKVVVEQIVTTLASVADTAQDDFTPYYDIFMPKLKYILQNAVSPEWKILRGKTIECISLIGLAVGKDKFMNDCNEVMQLLLRTQTDQSDLADDDPQVSYMMSAWARMCKILGKDFQQFLPVVMGPVLKAASLKPEVTLVDSDDVKNMENDTEWQFVTLGDQQSFGIRTAGLEEKSTACQMLVCYARELNEAFVEYAEEVVKIMVPLLKFYFHDDVRCSATESLPHLLECALNRGPQYLSEMWSYICPNLLKAIDIEPEKSVLPEHLHSLAKCIEKLGMGCLSEEHMTELMTICDKILVEHFKRQSERQDVRRDEDYDEIVEETLHNEDDEDVYILSKVADVIHSLFATHNESFLPMFEKLIPHFVKLLEIDRPWPDHQWSLCVWDDVIENTGPTSLKYRDQFLSRLLESICDTQAEVRQAAVYGVGVMAMFGRDEYASTCAESLPLLLRVIQDPHSREVENVPATENAISAVTKICKHNNSRVNVDDILPHWLSWLPVWEDDEEAKWVYEYLCDLIERNHPQIVGVGHQNLPRILSIIADTFISEIIKHDSEVYRRMLNIVKQVQVNENVFQACVSQLSYEQQTALSNAVSFGAVS